jgi:hypothetical protein
LSKSALDFESMARFVDNGQWQITLFSQKCALFLGYLTMTGSRMLMCLTLTNKTFDDWVFIFVIFVHVLITFMTHLFTHHIKAGKDGDIDVHFVFLRKFDWRLIPFALSEGFLVLLRSPMEYLGVYSHHQYIRKRWQFFSIYLIHCIEVVAVNLSFIFAILAKNPETFVTYRAMFIISLLSIGLHLLSGLNFAWYFFICRPKRKKTFKFVPESNSQILNDDEEVQHDYAWRERLCLKAEKVPEVNGCTSQKPAVGPGGQNKPKKRKKPKIKLKSVYFKV